MKRMTSKFTSTFAGALLIGAIGAAAPAVNPIGALSPIVSSITAGTAEAHLGDWSTQRDVTRRYCQDHNPHGIPCDYVNSAPFGDHSREFVWNYHWYNNVYCNQWIDIGHTYAIFNVGHYCYEDGTPS